MSNPESAPILLEQTLTPLSELVPLTRKVLVQLPPPAVADNRADVDRLRHVLEHQVSPVQIPLFLMHSIPILCSTQEPLTATLAPTGCGWQLMELEREDTTVEHYGLAVDIGTTTVVVYLIDMHSGAVLQKAAEFNAQIPFGEDRLKFSLKSFEDHQFFALSIEPLIQFLYVFPYIPKLNLNVGDILSQGFQLLPLLQLGCLHAGLSFTKGLQFG